jgi:hypothetical protein
LEEAAQGKNFRCTEYAIVATAALNAFGLKSRTVGLFTKDVETTTQGASHVVSEVYLNDLKKWVMLDGQHDVMPTIKGIPLNAVEFQDMLVNYYNAVELRSLSGTDKTYYANWIFPYLYYFETDLDNRQGIDLRKQAVKGGKWTLRLGPIGAKNPTIFQNQWPMTNAVYTNSIKDFYQPPVDQMTALSSDH